MIGNRSALLAFSLLFLGVGTRLNAAAPPETMAVPAIIDEKSLDRKVNPCDDFYQFACGGWEKTATIPDDRSSWSRSFLDIAERNLAKLHTTLEDFAKNPGEDADAKKLGDFYATCMDEKKAETESPKSLQVEMLEIDKLKDQTQLSAHLATLHLRGVNAFFGFGSFQDFHDSSVMIGGADQGGLTLPDRDYYLSKEGKMPEIRKHFRKHLIKMLTLSGVKPAAAAKNADTVIQIETELAKVSMSRVDRRDPNKVYHRLERKGLKVLASNFDWDGYFATLGLPKVEQINVVVPDYFKGFGELIAKTKLDDIRTYLRWQMLHAAADTLGKKFVDENFRFHSVAFGGEKKIKARWKRCVAATEGAMGESLGRFFVRANFPEEAKKQTREIISTVEDSFETNLKSLDWMDDKTKKEARAKAKEVVNQVGYPDKWRDFSKLQIGRESYLKNAFAAAAFNNDYDLSKIEKPVDRKEWGMYPQTVNAYYSPENNKMVFPAGILQSPFFDPSAPKAANYGAIGMVMGHEFTHGFDDEGKQFDEKGNLRNWWQPKVEEDFSKRAQCLAEQYDHYNVIDKLHVNGKLTLGENIADQGGIKLSYNAYLNQNGDKEQPKVAGFTDKQQFFVAFAQSWCSKRRPELARMLVTVDPHSPPKYRVNGPLTNFPKFAEVFQCKAGSPMAPVKACTVW